MKLSLRNFALGAAIVATGAMFAQDAPTVTQKWITHVTCDGSQRNGNAYGGKVYYADGNTIKTVCDGVIEDYITLEFAPNKGFFIDEAGNILAHKGFPGGASDWMNYALIKAADKSVTDITIKAPTEDTNWDKDAWTKRVDCAGRAIGDFFSEEGGLCYLGGTGPTYAIPVWIVEGEQVVTEYPTEAVLTAGSSCTIAIPAFESMEDVDADNVANGFWYMATNNGPVQCPYDGEAYNLPNPEGLTYTGNNFGFDIFTLGDETYCAKVAGTGTWNSSFVIFNIADGSVLFDAKLFEKSDLYGEGTGYGGNLVCRKVSDYKVELYRLYFAGTRKEASFAGMWEITIPGGDPVVEPEGLCDGDFENVTLTPAVGEGAANAVPAGKWGALSDTVEKVNITIEDAEGHGKVAKFDGIAAMSWWNAGLTQNIKGIKAQKYTLKFDAKNVSGQKNLSVYFYALGDGQKLYATKPGFDPGLVNGNYTSNASAGRWDFTLGTDWQTYEIEVDFSVLVNNVNSPSSVGVEKYKLAEATEEQLSHVRILINNNNKVGAWEIDNVTLAPVEEPATPDLYILGDITNAGWNNNNPDQFTYADGKYTYTVTGKGGEFKFSTAKGDWKAIDEAAWWPVGDVRSLKVGHYDLVNEFRDGYNVNIDKGDYVLTVDLAAKTLDITGEKAPFDAPNLYVRGLGNDWGEVNKMTTDGATDAEGNVTYTIELASVSGEFAIANESWSYKYCNGTEIADFGTYELAKGGNNAKFTKELKDVKLTFIINSDDTSKGTLIVEDNAAPVVELDARKPFAYDVKIEKSNTTGVYTVSYKATRDSEAAEIELTDEEGNVNAIALPAATLGENTATFDANELVSGKYNWTLRLQATAEETALVYNEAEGHKGAANQYGGPVWIHDVESPAYGYTVVGISGGKGFLVYNPEGELQYNGAIHTMFSGHTNGNSCIMRGAAHGGYAVFANWNDTGAGSWYVNPLDPTETPHNIFASEGATMAGNGLWSIGETAIGGGHTGIAFQGYGEDTRAWTFDEDLIGNKPHMYEVGTAQYITTAPVKSFTEDSFWASTHANFCATSKGVFICQHRATIGDQGTPSFAFYDRDGELVWTSQGDEYIVGGEGMTINADETLCAYTDYYGNIRICNFAWNGNEPVISEAIETITTEAGAGGTRVAMKFDAANNLHIYARSTVGYGVYTLAGTSKSAYVSRTAIALETGLNSLDTVAEGAVEYYNLQGVRVANPSNGIFIRRQGNTVTKVIIK